MPFNAGTAFRDEANGLCDMAPFEACVKAYQRLLDPDAALQLENIALTLNEVPFIANEVSMHILPSFKVHTSMLQQLLRAATSQI